ncbi:heterogeneous nuclear ribonucleoprotein 1-like [Rosa chinensis]|uniref:heterogeneous nuclear ribonucleoprotein 1-like n=1 Tax=Rosa chinensis TaxID=74649 RepID=UPI001AD8ADB7|nr:heterogeneous nuclear ribonucleoprotein 1-like [Rosa chinensis]
MGSLCLYFLFAGRDESTCKKSYQDVCCKDPRPQSVTEAKFRGHFGKYGEITDLYMPKDQGSKMHRGIGFITFENADSEENLMADTHELGGSNVVVD